MPLLPTDRQRLITGAIAALIVMATVVAYGPALHGDFIWDDFQYVRDNPELRSPGGLWNIWFAPMATPQYDPLTFSSFWVEYHLWGLDTLGYHIGNVILHAANALLLWVVLVELGIPGGALAAAIFALHPVHLESVAWIVERKNILSALFGLATILAWVRFIAPHGPQRPRTLYALALAFYACTLLSKPVLCTLPAALLLLAWWKRPADWHKAIAALLPFALLSVAIGLLAWWREQPGNPPQPLSVLERLLIMNHALWFYAGKLLWPTTLTPIYPRWEMQATPASLILLVASIVVAVLLWSMRGRLGNGLLVAVGCFAITLLPLLGVVDFGYLQYSFVADHFQYLPSASLITALAAAATIALQRAGGPGRAGGWCCLAVLLLILASLTWRSAAHYATAETFWRDVLAKNPRAWNAESNLAATLVTKGRLDEAIAHYKAALDIRPDFPEAHNRWGIVLAKQGKADEAVAQFDMALQLNSAQADAHNNAGAVLAQQGKWAEAAERFAAAIRINPAYVEAYDSWGIVVMKQGRGDEAISHFEAALAIRPDYVPSQQHLARARSLKMGTAAP